MKNVLKPLLLASLMALPMIQTAYASRAEDLLARRQELRQELAENERIYKQAVAEKDWDKAKDALHDVRDSERELRLRAQIGHELPVEAELERWFPLWGIPI